MDIPLRVLIIEDSDRDVALEVRALKAAGYQVTYAVAETAVEMKAALAEQAFDIVISDHGLPQFDAPGALAVLKQSGLDIPFIVVSGSIGEETAVALMKAGAHDYVMKDRLARLVPAVQKELRDAESRVQRKRAEDALQESEALFRKLFEDHAAVMLILNPDTGNIIDANEAAVVFYGWSREQLKQRKIQEINTLSPEEVKKEMEKVRAQKKLHFEFRHRLSDGSVRDVDVFSSIIEVNKRTLLHSIVYDITGRRRAEEELKVSDAQYRLLAEHMTDIVWMMNLDLNVTWLSPSAMKARGFSVDEISALPLDRQLTPDSLGKAVNWLGKLMRLEKDGLLSETDGILSRELEFYCKDGRTIVLDCTFQFIRDEQGKATGILAEGRDITKRKKAEEDLKETLGSLRKAVGATIQTMVSAVEMRDPYTAGHQLRTANLACAIATEIGLPQEKIDGIRMAGSIHDIGKLSVPAEILSKPTKLTNIEFSLIKEHSQKGYEMLKDMESSWPLAEIVYQHHERMDGSGYPRNLKGEEICMEARILAVADVVEAMASHRPYRPSLGIDATLNEIEKNRGTLYDKAVVDTCLKLFREKGFKLEGT